MSYSEIIGLLAATGLIVAGIIIRIDIDKEKYGIFHKYWFLFILIGVFLLSFNIYKFYG